MGAGFALFVAERDAQRTVTVAHRLGIGARVAGHVEAAGSKELLIEPLSLRFDGDELRLR
jgi:phosphoribosylformylglycinamidine cyclo-ligase